MYCETAEKNLTSFQAYFTTLGYCFLVATAFVAPISITATNIFMTVTAIIAVLSGQFSRSFTAIKNNPLILPITLFIAIVTIGMFWSIGSWDERLAGLHKYAKLLYIPFLIPFCLEEKWRQRAINGFLIAIIITVLASYFKAYLGTPDPQGPNWIFHSHIETSYFVAFSAYLCADRAWKKHQYRWLNWLLFTLFTYQEFFINDGRTGWLVYFCLILLFFIQRIKPDPLSNQRAIWKTSAKSILRGLCLGLSFFILLTVASYNFSPWFQQEIKQTYYSTMLPADENNPGSINLRLSFYQFGIQLLHMHPITGLGTGSLPAAYRQSPGIKGWGNNLTSIHNEYLHVLIQLGLIGLFALLFFFYQQWKMSFNFDKNRHPAQALVLSFMVASLFNTFLYSTVTGHFYVLFTSLLFAVF